jgi:hypothetical protein
VAEHLFVDDAVRVFAVASVLGMTVKQFQRGVWFKTLEKRPGINDF